MDWPLRLNPFVRFMVPPLLKLKSPPVLARLSAVSTAELANVKLGELMVAEELASPPTTLAPLSRTTEVGALKVAGPLNFRKPLLKVSEPLAELKFTPPAAVRMPPGVEAPPVMLKTLPELLARVSVELPPVADTAP